MLLWNIKRLWKKNLSIKEGKENQQKIKFFFYSIIFGLIFSILFVYIFQEEPFTLLYDGIIKTFENDFKINRMLQQITILGLAGIAVGIGFKAKVFNIGVSGQMIFGGMVAGLIALNVGPEIPNVVGQILIVFVSMFVGAFVAGICGLLKVYFRIHEVVSTILVNWIAFYFLKWMLDPNSSNILNDTLAASKMISSNYLLRIDDDPTIPLMIILAVTAFFIWVFIYKTRYGMLIKMTGLNPDASRYSGVNTKLVMFYSISLSGAIAGLLGATLYFGIQDNFKVPLIDKIPSEGFDGIAIAIISYSNPLSIILVSFIFSLIESGIKNTAQAIDSNFISLVFGVLLYISAINKIFAYLDFKKTFRKVFYSKEKNKLCENYLKQKEDIDSNYYDEYIFSKNFKKNSFEKLKQNKEKLIMELKQNNQKQTTELKQNQQKIITEWKENQQKIAKELKNKLAKIILNHQNESKKLKMSYVKQKKMIMSKKDGE